MLAGIAETVHAWKSFEVSDEKSAVEALLAGLIDYAGLFPPAGLDMRTAVRHYLAYREGMHRAALGRFVVSLDRLGELRTAAEDSFAEMRLSVILAPGTDLSTLPEAPGNARDRCTFECKVREPSEIERVTAQSSPSTDCYFEIPMDSTSEPLLEAIALHGARAKLRTGGVVSEAFPSAKAVVWMLQALAERRLVFKATAGLHHPVRSRHRYTYQPDSSEGMMHGFLNVVFAATVLHFGGSAGEALHVLEEEDPQSWQVTPESIRCRASLWSADQLRAVREHFFVSFGSCSFEEPMSDLEAMGWV